MVRSKRRANAAVGNLSSPPRVRSGVCANNFMISTSTFHPAMGRSKPNPRRGPVASSNPMANLEKTAVLQETRMFNETPVNARKCTHILTKILYLINQVSWPPFRPRTGSPICSY